MARQTPAELDIRYLESVADGADPEARVALAVELASFFKDLASPASERRAVLPVLQKLAVDPDAAVRRAIADAFRHSTATPIELVFAIAADEDEIAVPFLTECPALDAGAMLAVVRVGDEVRQLAIAGRRDLPVRVVREIVERGSATLCAAMLENPGVTPSPGALRRIYRRHGAEAAIAERMVARDDLPIELRIRIAHDRSCRLKELMRARGWFPANDGDEVVADAEERALVRIFAGASDPELATVARVLHDGQQLTPSLLLRAACLGHMRFVERALSLIAGIPPSRLCNLLYASNALSLKAVHARAGLPASCFALLRLAVEVERQAMASGGRLDPPAFTRALIERLVTGCNGLEVRDKAATLAMIERLGDDSAHPLAARLRASLASAA
jgi:uncharacterized protein (DUF2336 family)